jgi:hypothetical protein
MELNERLALATRVLPDGRILDVVPLLPGTVRLCVTRPEDDGMFYDDVF